MDISEEAKDLTHKMLDVNPNTRITIDEALEHPWIKVLLLLYCIGFMVLYI